MAIELYHETYVNPGRRATHSLNLEKTIFPEDRDLLSLAGKIVKEQVCARWQELGHPVSGPDAVMGTPYDSPAGGWRWPNPERPLRWKLDKQENFIPDCMGNSSLIDINDKVRDILESIEPGVHNYIECELYAHRGEFIERRWLVNICTRIETLAVGHGRVSEDTRTHLYAVYGDLPYDVAAWADRIAGRAIWNEYRWSDKPLISDAFVKRLKEAGARGWDYGGNPFGARHIREI